MKVKTNGIEINYEVEGNGPWITLSHSLACNLHMWDDQAPALSKQFRLVRYDRRGHGKSGAPKGPYTMDRLGKDVLADGLKPVPHDPLPKTKFDMKLTGPGGNKQPFIGPHVLRPADRARHVGEAVAMVMAETRAQAMDAAEAVAVDAPEPSR